MKAEERQATQRKRRKGNAPGAPIRNGGEGRRECWRDGVLEGWNEGEGSLIWDLGKARQGRELGIRNVYVWRLAGGGIGSREGGGRLVQVINFSGSC